jgi:hypothetical protein
MARDAIAFIAALKHAQVEREFADALGASVGDHLTINGHQFTVDGIAVTAATAPYPNICYSGCYINPFWYAQG